MRSRTIAIVGSIAALSFAATPIAAVAATNHTAASAARADRSRDSRDVRHVDKTPDTSRTPAARTASWTADDTTRRGGARNKPAHPKAGPPVMFVCH